MTQSDGLATAEPVMREGRSQPRPRRQEVRNMKKQDAIEKGYTYTGVSDLSGDGSFTKAREGFKAAGYKTVIVNERVSQYSRSGAGTPYRVLYAEQRYYDDEAIKKYEKELAGMDGCRAAAEEAYKAELQKIADRGIELEARIADLKAKKSA